MISDESRGFISVRTEMLCEAMRKEGRLLAMKTLKESSPCETGASTLICVVCGKYMLTCTCRVHVHTVKTINKHRCRP